MDFGDIENDHLDLLRDALRRQVTRINERAIAGQATPYDRGDYTRARYVIDEITEHLEDEGYE